MTRIEIIYADGTEPFRHERYRVIAEKKLHSQRHALDERVDNNYKLFEHRRIGQNHTSEQQGQQQREQGGPKG